MPRLHPLHLKNEGSEEMMRVTKMLKDVFLRAWGRGKVTLLTVMVALTLATVTPAVAANGGSFLLGKANVATAVTLLKGTVAGPALQVYNPSTSASATAALFQVASGQPPFKVNSSTKVANLNADQLDGQDSSAFAQRSGFNAQQVLSTNGPLPKQAAYTSKGGTLLITASGSGFQYSGNTLRTSGRIGMSVKVDQAQYIVGAFVNDKDHHYAFVPETFVVSGVAAGQHTISLEALYTPVACDTSRGVTPDTYCTTTDGNDPFSVTVLELPA